MYLNDVPCCFFLVFASFSCCWFVSFISLVLLGCWLSSLLFCWAATALLATQWRINGTRSIEKQSCMSLTLSLHFSFPCRHFFVGTDGIMFSELLFALELLMAVIAFVAIFIQCYVVALLVILGVLPEEEWPAFVYHWLRCGDVGCDAITLFSRCTVMIICRWMRSGDLWSDRIPLFSMSVPEE